MVGQNGRPASLVGVNHALWKGQRVRLMVNSYAEIPRPLLSPVCCAAAAAAAAAAASCLPLAAFYLPLTRRSAPHPQYRDEQRRLIRDDVISKYGDLMEPVAKK